MWIAIIVLAILVLWVIGAYNTLIKLRTRSDEALADIDVQLKRRHDLIPNLVETVKAYAKHEKEVFQAVTEARASAVHARSMESKAEAENVITDALKSLFAVAENYPELKASENFQQLQTELSDTENKIEAARRFYNTNVRDYNIALDSFPTNVIANAFHFTDKELFEAQTHEREVPKVSFESTPAAEEKTTKSDK